MERDGDRVKFEVSFYGDFEAGIDTEFDVDRWDDEKLFVHGPATREGFKCAYRAARVLLKGGILSKSMALLIQASGKTAARMVGVNIVQALAV